jgi:Flp pilus assembly protein TadG
MTKRTRQREIRTQRRGVTTVEFALVAPLFFLILFALFEFSWLNVIRHTADTAAYEASRAAIVPGATADEAIARATQILRMVGTRGANVTVDPPTLSPGTTSVTVAIEVPMRVNAIITPKFTGNSVLRSQSTLRTERVQNR